MPETSKDVTLGEESAVEAKAQFDDIVSFTIDAIANKIKEIMPELPDIIIEEIQHTIKNLETENEIISECSKELYAKEYIDSSQLCLDTNMLVHNFHQDGYDAGLYSEYCNAMMAMVDNNASDELILAVRKELLPTVLRNPYEDCKDVIEKYKSDKYSWIESKTENNPETKHC